MRIRGDVTERNRARWLKAYAQSGIITHACQVTGFSRTTVYRWMEVPAFKAAMGEALEIAREVTELEFYRRAVEGVVKDVYYQGEVVGQVREYSDTLLLARMKRLDPAYRDQSSVDVRAQLKAQMEIAVTDAREAARANLTPDELDRIARAVLDR